MSDPSLIEADDLPQADLRRQLMGPLISGALGVALWSYMCSSALEIELGHAASRPGMIGVLLAPLGVLAITLLLRRPLLALVTFPVALLPCIIALEPLDLRAFNTLEGGLTLSGGLIAFLLATARLMPADDNPTAQAWGERGDSVVSPEFWSLLRHMGPRIVLMFALYILPLSALYSDSGQLQLRESFPDRHLDAAFLIHSIHVFIATIATYVALISPSINRPLDAFELRESLKRERRSDRQNQRWRRLWLRTLLITAALISARFVFG